MKFIVPRERLQTLGQRILDHRVTTVTSPAGYGKTVWVASLLNNPGWPPTAWISLDHQDAEPSILLYRLIHAFGRILPGFGGKSLRTLSSVEILGRDWPIVVLSFLEEIPLKGELLLVLDDLHLLYENEVCCSIVEHLLQRLPENIHTVLISRTPPPFKLYRQELNDDLLKVGSLDLLFTEAEARALFSNMDLLLPDSDASVLYARTEGWAVGLRLLGIYLKQSGGVLDDAMRVSQQEDSTFYVYLMNEFLGTMPDDIRDFFIDASLLPYLEPGLCDAAFLREDSSIMLETLRGFGLFGPSEEKDGIWRMHHLIGDWLQDSVYQLRSQQHIDSIRNRASRFFERRGDINLAIEQAVLSRDWVRAATLINQYAYDYFAQASQLDILYKWIEELPEGLVEKDCWLLYFKGLSILYIDNEQSFRVLSAAADKAVQVGDIKCEASSLLAMLHSTSFSGDLKKSEKVSLRLMGKPVLLKNPLSRAEALTAAMAYAMATDNLRDGLSLSRKALRLKLQPELRMWVLYITSHLLFRAGSLVQARELVDEALSMPYVQENERRLAIGYEILCDLAFISGDYYLLEEITPTCLNLGKKYNMLGIVGRYHSLKAHRYFREGRLMEARQQFDLAYECFVTAGIVHFANQTKVDVRILQITNGEDVDELLAELLEMKARFEENPYGLGVDYHVNTLVGVAAMEAGNLELAGELFEKSARRWREIEAKQHLAGTNLLMAHLLLLQGREKASDDLLLKALGASEAWQWENYWEWHHETIYSMCRRAVQKNIHARWAARLLGRWFPERSRQELGLLLVDPDEQVRSLAREFFQQNGKTVFHVFYLGRFRLFVNGIEIEETDWKTKKAETLFKFLVADRNQHHKEYLMQHLWPDSDPRSSDGKLRMTLSYVRKALASAGLPPDCLAVQRGIICLDPGYEVCCDYELFSQEARKAMRYSEINHPYAIPALEQAIRIYNGEFLPEDLYEDWATGLRAALRNLYLELLAQLGRAHLANGNLPAARQAFENYLALEPVDENLIRLTMDVLNKMGKKHKSLELYRNLEAILAKEYSTTPEPETTARYHMIQGGAEKPGLPI